MYLDGCIGARFADVSNGAKWSLEMFGGIDTFDDFELLVVVHEALPPSCKIEVLRMRSKDAFCDAFCIIS